MDPEDIILSEISQKEKGKYCMISLIWNIKLRNEPVELNKNKHVDNKNRVVFTRGEGCGG